jgi:hypothetical protein
MAINYPAPYHTIRVARFKQYLAIVCLYHIICVIVKENEVIYHLATLKRPRICFGFVFFFIFDTVMLTFEVSSTFSTPSFVALSTRSIPFIQKKSRSVLAPSVSYVQAWDQIRTRFTKFESNQPNPETRHFSHAHAFGINLI